MRSIREIIEEEGGMRDQVLKTLRENEKVLIELFTLAGFYHGTDDQNLSYFFRSPEDKFTYTEVEPGGHYEFRFLITVDPCDGGKIEPREMLLSEFYGAFFWRMVHDTGRFIDEAKALVIGNLEANRKLSRDIVISLTGGTITELIDVSRAA